MISEFQDLSDKIDLLAQLTASLRSENAALRQANTMLAADNVACTALLAEAQRRVVALLEKIPASVAGDTTVTDDEAAPQ